MESIDAMLSQIKDKAKSEQDKRYLIAENKIKADEAKQLKNLADNLNSQQLKIEKHYKNEFKQASQRESLAFSRQLLQQKQQYLAQIFADVEQSLLSQTSDQLLENVELVIVNSVFTGKLTLQFGSLTPVDLTDEQVQKLKSLNPTVQLTVLKDGIPAAGGFVIAQGGIQYNFLYHAILADIQQQQSGRLSAILFPGENQ